MTRTLVKIASSLFPNQVVSFAYGQLTNPQVRKLRPHEQEVLDQAQQESFAFKDFDIRLYTWAGGPESILLIHGWEGQAGNFADFVEALLEKGYTVHAFDGPSHGYSSSGKTSLFEFAELVGVLIEKYGVRKLVSHSFGGVATTYALFKNPALQIDKYLLLTTPDKFTERIDDVAQQVGITETVKRKLIERLENEVGQSVEQLNVSAFVRSIQVDEALIIHDRNDKVIPIERSQNVHKNWPSCAFQEIQDTGHFRILRTSSVVERGIAFLNT